MPRPANGFTLLEALIVMTIVALLLAVALPAFSHAKAAAESSAVRADLAATLLDAVRHSSIAGTEVVVCPGPAAGQCHRSPVWEKGWMAFADINGNRVLDANETVLVQKSALPSGVRLRSTAGRTRVVFQPSGGNAGSNVTFTLCDSRGTKKASTLVLSNTGVLRAGKATTKAAWNCVYGG